ncbi:MAG: hypothetical protein IH863_09400 [Chloroflexi bacterium]|nr:hypothetical protein [Chloroflexota bacterium]
MSEAPVTNGAEALDAVHAFIRRYVATGDAEADTLAIWAAHSWAIDAGGRDAIHQHHERRATFREDAMS